MKACFQRLVKLLVWKVLHVCKGTVYNCVVCHKVSSNAFCLQLITVRDCVTFVKATSSFPPSEVRNIYHECHSIKVGHTYKLYTAFCIKNRFFT